MTPTSYLYVITRTRPYPTAPGRDPRPLLIFSELNPTRSTLLGFMRQINLPSAFVEKAAELHDERTFNLLTAMPDLPKLEHQLPKGQTVSLSIFHIPHTV